MYERLSTFMPKVNFQIIMSFCRSAGLYRDAVFAPFAVE